MVTFEAIKHAVKARKGETWDRFCERRGDWGRDVVLYLARRHSGLTLPEIAKAAGGADYRSVGKAVERMEAKARQDKAIRKILLKLEK